MPNFIDRNPEQMMKFGTEAKKNIGDMILMIRKVEGILDSCASDLDEPTRKQIQKLHECCNTYLKKIDVYQNIADDIYKKGKRLSEIRNGGY